MTPLSAEAERVSRRLAALLGQDVPAAANVRRVSENVVEVRSRNPKTPNTWYAVTRGGDDSLICSCIASFYPYRGECWHQNAARKVFDMTTETSRALTPIVVQPSVALLPSSHELDVVDRAAAMAYAGAVSLPAELNTKEKVAAVMLYGLELGLKPMTALRHLYIVKGRVSPSAELMAGLCLAKERDISFHIEELNDQKCTIRMVRPSRKVNEVMTITWKQIQTAGLATDTNAKYPEDRLRYHTMKRLMRAYAQDLINNLDDGVVLAGLTEDQPWRPTVVDSSEFYNEGDVDRETGEIFEHEAPQQEPNVSDQTRTVGPGIAPAAASVAVPAADITQALNAISERHGQQAKAAAISVMTRFYDTAAPAKLDTDQRVEYLAMLKVRLDAIEHEHEGAFTAYGHPVCRICGDDVKPPVGQEIQQPALSP